MSILDNIAKQTRKCVQCKEKYTVQRDYYALYIHIWRQTLSTELFCGFDCAKEYMMQKGVKKVCENCRKEFYVLKKNKPGLQRFCSDVCADEYIDKRYCDHYEVAGV